MSLSHLIWALQSRDRGILRKTIHSKLVWFVRLLVFNERYIYTSKWDDAPPRRGVIDYITHNSTVNVINSGVDTGGGSRGQSATPDSEKFCQKSGKRGKNQEKIGKKRGRIGKRGKNRKGSFTLPLLTDRAGNN